jgi:hypothetical protein
MFEEKLFQFIWQNRCFDQKHLHTLQGDVVEIIAQGNLNHQGGPDFLNAKIKIGQNIWVGHIELHLKTSDWNKHKHQFDKKYDNVILHVVFQNDIDFETQNLPILELNGRISRQLLNVYHQQMKNSDLLLCKNLGKDVPSIIWTNWKERLMLERLQKKASSIQLDYEILNKDWNQVAYIQMAKYFGVPSNKDNFHQLAFNIDYRILLKNHQNLFAIESILFGTSGLVDIESKEKYPNNLKEEFEFWQQKYDLKKMKSYQWQWLRMRPNSFPTIRIALFSALCQEMLPFLISLLINQVILLKR